MSVFPLIITEKEDTPERVITLADVQEKHKFMAVDQNIIIAALKELHARGMYLADNDGLEWYVRKANDKLNVTEFENGDKIEAFIDAQKTQWREGVIMGPGFTGVADMADDTKYFSTNKATRRT